MDISTIIGLLVALVGLFVGMLLKGVGAENLANGPAILIIIAGTIGAVTIASPLEKLKNVPKLFGVIFGNTKIMSKVEAIKLLTSLAEMVRKDGILVLESQMSSITEPFLVNGLQMMIDGADSHAIAQILEAEIASMEERHAANAQIFLQAGSYAPTLGVLGAVIGLIAALGYINDTEKLGHAIAAAFVATLLGIFTGYVLWHPFANKLKQKSKIEVSIKTLMLEGIISLCEGQSPRMLSDRLTMMLPTSERPKVSGDKAG